MLFEIKNLTKEYKQGDQIIRALSELDFSMPQGAFYSITGRSGSGKSTLLNIIAGLTLPSSGNVIYKGQDIFTLSDKEFSMYRNTKIGCIPQQHSILSNLTVLDNVRIPFYLSKKSGSSAEKARSLLSLVGMEKLAHTMPKRLSGGQLKRVAIARAMMNAPELLLADEPTGDLDAETTREIMAIFRALVNEGTTLLMVTHDLDTTAYADKNYIMQQGTLTE
jgi:putative ABC transport system ATP-binding protein